MATLEHRTENGRDCFRLRFTVDKRRESIGLRDFDKASATIAKSHIEHLVGQHRRDRPPCDKTMRWLESLPAEIHDRMAEIGLVEARTRCELPRTLIGFMRAYIKSRTDWKKPANYKQSVDHLEKFLKGDIPLASLTDGEADRWHQWMMTSKKGPKLSPNTAGQHVKPRDDAAETYQVVEEAVRRVVNQLPEQADDHGGEHHGDQDQRGDEAATPELFADQHGQPKPDDHLKANRHHCIAATRGKVFPQLLVVQDVAEVLKPNPHRWLARDGGVVGEAEVQAPEQGEDIHHDQQDQRRPDEEVQDGAITEITAAMFTPAGISSAYLRVD